VPPSRRERGAAREHVAKSAGAGPPARSADELARRIEARERIERPRPGEAPSNATAAHRRRHDARNVPIT
jgi:hypothetical protein